MVTSRIAFAGCRRLLKSPLVGCWNAQSLRSFSFNSKSIAEILASVKSGSISPQDAENMIGSVPAAAKAPEDTLQSFANLDHTRSFRTGFPEVVFAETKTSKQVAMILDDMARHVNEMVQRGTDFSLPGSTAILATR